MAEGDYVTSWDTSAQGNIYPYGATHNNGTIYTSHYYAQYYKWETDGDFIASGALTAANGGALDMTTEGNYIWITDGPDTLVYKYSMVFGYEESFNPEGAHVYGIATDGTYLYVCADSEKVVYVHNLAGVYQNTSFSVDNGSGDIRGMTCDGDFLFVINDDKSIHKYELDGTYIGSFEIAETTLPSGLGNDGTYFYVADPSADKVFVYQMSGAAAGGTNSKVNIGDAWKEVSTIKVNIGDTWKTANAAKINVSDTWKTIF